MRRGIRALPLAAALLAMLTLAGPAAPQAVTAGAAATARTAALTAATATGDCDPNVGPRSRPPSLDESGPGVQAIKKRGMLLAGIDLSSYRWGSRNPNDNRPEGFDIDLVRAIAKAILGDPDKVQFKVIPMKRRQEALDNDEIDLMARTITITCDRAAVTPFSTVYFQAGQQVVVPRSAKATSVDGAIKGKTVCVADSSTAQAQMNLNRRGAAAVTVADNALDCLVRMQLGQADVTLTDNAVAVGQAAQDPTVEVIGPSITSEPYGIAMPLRWPDLVARVNQVLVDYRKDGWQASYDKWLAPYLGPTNGPPPIGP
ncbi:glutamate ABC transporter substrate-binding protein [Kitasatospora nipponensis]|uniref:Glutamate ABC transporter substrate-binding protein n=1 Tax=Kitasatospora nipponensis TaxID=258049 RepID=A0ABN1WSZ8_9ACTN